MPDLAGAAVDDVGRLAQRAHVVLDRPELADRHHRERGVLAVRAEQPRIVGEAGAQPAGARELARGRRVLLALVDPADLEVLARTGSSRRGSASPSRPPARAAGRRAASPASGAPAARGARSCGRARRPGRRAQRRARDAPRRDPRPSRPPRPTASSSRPPARSARSGAGRPCRVRTGRRRTGSAAPRPCRRCRPGRRGSSRPSRPRPASRFAATSAAQSCGSAFGCGSLPCSRKTSALPSNAAVSARLSLACGITSVEAPRVGAEQLGVRVHLHRDRPRGRARVAHVQPEQRRAAAVRREVRAAQLEPGGRRQVHLGVAPAAPEARRGADPLVVDAEPDAVDQLERRRPHAAHLARDVPAVARRSGRPRSRSHRRARTRRCSGGPGAAG